MHDLTRLEPPPGSPDAVGEHLPRLRRHRPLAVPHLLLRLAVLGALLVPLSWHFPLGLCRSQLVVTSAGVHDNRRWLLGWLGLVVAAAIVPLADRWKPRPGAPVKESDEAVPSAAVGARWWLFWIGLAGALVFLLVGPGIRFRAINGHELLHLGYLGEMANGRLLNVETLTAYGPLLGRSIAAFMNVVGYDIGSFRLYWNMANAVTLALLLLLLVPWWKRRWLLVVLVGYLLLHTSARHYLPDGRGINGGFWGWGNILRHGWPALLIFGLPRVLRGRFRGLGACLLGAGWALGAQYAPETAAPGALTVGCLLLGAGAGLTGRLARLTGMATAAAVVTTSVLLWPILSRGGLSLYWFRSTIVSQLTIRGIANTGYPAPWMLDRSGHFALVPYYALPLLSLGGWLFGWHRLLTRRGDPGVLAALGGCAVLSWASVIVRADQEHMLNASLMPLLLGFCWLDGAWDALRQRAGRFAGALPGLILLPILVGQPSAATLFSGLAGRLLHPNPAPPAGMARLALDRAGIWVPRIDCWFDLSDWGCGQDTAAVTMIRNLSKGRPTLITGNRASLMYFLTGCPSVTPYTDLSSQALTVFEYRDHWARINAHPPAFIFVQSDRIENAPGDRDGYRVLGARHGYVVSQREDLEPVTLPP